MACDGSIVKPLDSRRHRDREKVSALGRCPLLGSVRYREGACGVVVSMFDFHRSDRGSNPGRGGKIS